MSKYLTTAYSIIQPGREREHTEDFIWTQDLSSGKTDTETANAHIFLIADGKGCYPGCLQAEQIICPFIIDCIQKCYDEARETFLNDPIFHLKMAMYSANKVIGGFKLGNEEKYNGYGASVTIALVLDDKLYYAHVGNTRLYILRQQRLRQLTKDQTAAQQLLDEGKINEELYYSLPESRTLTGGLGYVADPEIESGKLRIKNDDIFLMTTDGIHMFLRPQGMADLILSAGTCEGGANVLLEAGEELGSGDDMSCTIFTCYGSN